MLLKVERKWRKRMYTVGRMYVDGTFFCNTLEDTVRELPKEAKIYGRTAIPKGRYKVIYNMSPRFGRKLPRLVDVPLFQGVLIHPGNTAEDTSGCILVGRNTDAGRLTGSRETSDELNKLISLAIDKGEDVWIEITEP